MSLHRPGVHQLDRWQHQVSLLTGRSRTSQTPSLRAGQRNRVPEETGHVAGRFLDRLAFLQADCSEVELQQYNDEANLLLRQLPMHHTLRTYAAREGLELPGRPGYFYFKRCQELLCVVEASQSLNSSSSSSSATTVVAEPRQSREAVAETPEKSSPYCQFSCQNLFVLIAYRRTNRTYNCAREMSKVLTAVSTDRAKKDRFAPKTLRAQSENTGSQRNNSRFAEKSPSARKRPAEVDEILGQARVGVEGSSASLGSGSNVVRETLRKKTKVLPFGQVPNYGDCVQLGAQDALAYLGDCSSSE